MKRLDFVATLVIGLAGALPLLVRADIPSAAPRSAGQSASPRAPDRGASDDRHSLRRGVVTRVSTNAERIEIQGQWFRIDPAHTRILRGGQVIRPDAIRTGQTLEFTLLPGRDAQRGLGVVYVR